MAAKGAETDPTAVDGKLTVAGATVGNGIEAMPELLTGAVKLPADVDNENVAE